jgi:hypothetical protein
MAGLVLRDADLILRSREAGVSKDEVGSSA